AILPLVEAAPARQAVTKRMEAKRVVEAKPVAAARNRPAMQRAKPRAGPQLVPVMLGAGVRAPVLPRQAAPNRRPMHRVVKTRQNPQDPAFVPERLAATTGSPAAPRRMSPIWASWAVTAAGKLSGPGAECCRVLLFLCKA